mgnify:CR=1 FL=1
MRMRETPQPSLLPPLLDPSEAMLSSRVSEGTTPLERAREALRQGAYDRVLDLLPSFDHDVEACLLRIDALANHEGSGRAAEAASLASRLHPASVELHFRHALLLSSIGQLEGAIRVGVLPEHVFGHRPKTAILGSDILKQFPLYLSRRRGRITVLEPYANGSIRHSDLRTS